MNLAAEMAKLPEPPNNSKPPLWDAWRHNLWRKAQDDDPHNFMQWPCVYHTMLQDHWRGAVDLEIDYIADKLDVQPVFPPAFLSKHRHLLSAWYSLAHQTYHILRWEEATGLNIADMQSIYEFGGGYGAMALVCNRLGFRGKYYIYDLPEFSLLQQWYLEECGVGNVEWVGADAYGYTDLLIACYSLSETDFAERDRILAERKTGSYLFLYSNKFEDYDNIGYFRGLESGQLCWTVGHWAHSHIDHLPPESWYSWGW